MIWSKLFKYFKKLQPPSGPSSCLWGTPGHVDTQGVAPDPFVQAWAQPAPNTSLGPVLLLSCSLGASVWVLVSMVGGCRAGAGEAVRALCCSDGSTHWARGQRGGGGWAVGSVREWTLEDGQGGLGQSLSLLYNMLSRLAVAFLSRSKRLLISWLQSPPAVILEPPKIKCHCFHCFPIYLLWSDGTGCHDLSFLNVEL